MDFGGDRKRWCQDAFSASWHYGTWIVKVKSGRRNVITLAPVLQKIPPKGNSEVRRCHPRPIFFPIVRRRADHLDRREEELVRPVAPKSQLIMALWGEVRAVTEREL